MLDESSGVAHKRKDELALMRLEFGLPQQKYLPHDIPLRRNFWPTVRRSCPAISTRCRQSAGMAQLNSDVFGPLRTLTEVFHLTLLAAIGDDCSHKVSQMQIRNASKEDALRCVELVEARRKEYENYEPRFWKKAANSAASTLSWFEKLFCDEDTVALVAVENTLIVGFLIAREFPTPPVYDPGGATALIDDFCVAAKDRWQDAGAALLQRAKSELNRRGFAQVVVVGAQRDAAKTALLSHANLSLASTWWTAEV